VFLVLNSTRSTEIINLLKTLSGEQQDLLMAYLYKVAPKCPRIVHMLNCWLIYCSVVTAGNGQSRRRRHQRLGVLDVA
jgi:hypothetical protein